MTEPLKDRVVLITGASRGIGRKIALTAVNQGAAVVIAVEGAELFVHFFADV